MTEGIVKKPRNNSSKYTEQEIELALRQLAINSGNTRRTDRDTGIPFATLYRWKTKQFAERYVEIQREVMPGVKAWLHDEHMRYAGRAIEVGNQVVDKLEKEVEEIPSRDLAGAARNLGVIAGVSTEHAAKLRGEATSIIEHRTTPDELARKLERAGVTFVEAEVVEESALEQRESAPKDALSGSG